MSPVKLQNSIPMITANAITNVTLEKKDNAFSLRKNQKHKSLFIEGWLDDCKPGDPNKKS
jgi:hypothetical protein